MIRWRRSPNVSWRTRLVCWLRGHEAYRIRGTFLVKCDRCGKSANLRLWAGKE